MAGVYDIIGNKTRKHSLPDRIKTPTKPMMRITLAAREIHRRRFRAFACWSSSPLCGGPAPVLTALTPLVPGAVPSSGSRSAARWSSAMSLFRYGLWYGL